MSQPPPVNAPTPPRAPWVAIAAVAGTLGFILLVFLLTWTLPRALHPELAEPPAGESTQTTEPGDAGERGRSGEASPAP